MTAYRKIISIIALTFLMQACSEIQPKHTEVVAHAAPHHGAKNSVKILHLEPKIHALLQQEMQAIQSGMMSLIPAIASGNWEEVTKIGKQMESSYLMKQQLTTAQRHALHKTLPADFIKRDKAFHKAAGMLAHAAEMGHPDIVTFYLYKLSNACVECHTEFATTRFPNLAAKQSDAHHH